MTIYKNWKKETESTGTVSSVGVNTGNGFSGSVTDPTGDARINLQTSITGLIKGNGVSLLAATNADIPITNSLTTSENTMTSVVNSQTSTADIINSISLDLTGTTLTNTINGELSNPVQVQPLISSPTLNNLVAMSALGKVIDAGVKTTTSSASSSTTELMTSSGIQTLVATKEPTITVLPIAKGGTGQTTANAALNALLPSQTLNSGKVFTTNATNTSWVDLSGVSVTSFNSRIGAVTTASGDYDVSQITGAAPLLSPSLTGNPTAPTQIAGDNSTKIATTAYADSGIALKANTASPNLTGVPTAPTATALTSTTQLATTAFVTTAGALKANIASPNLTGVPTAPTATAGTNNTQIATTAYSDTALTTGLALKANTASPNLTGVPTAPTASPGTNTSQIATTAFVTAASGTMVASFNGRTGTVLPVSGDYTYAQVTGAAPLASPALTGTPTAPTASSGTSTTQLATTAFVTAVAPAYTNVAASGNFNLTSQYILTTQNSDATTMRLPDAATTLESAIYTIKLIGPAANATITVPVGQYLNDTLNGTVSIVATPGAVASFRSTGANYWVQVDNTAALGLKANLSGGATFTGNIIVPDQSAGDNSSKAANTKYIDSSLLTFNNINGLKLSWASNTTLGLTSGYWNVLGSSIMFTSPSVTIDITHSGVVNGLDTGSAANSTNYYVYAIAHGTTPSLNGAILSTNSTTPALPSGYTSYRNIGRVRRDGSGIFIPFIQTGNGNIRTITYNGAMSTTQVGAGLGSKVFAALSLSNFVPPGCRCGVLRFDKTTTVASSYFAVRESGSSVTELTSLRSLCTGAANSSIKLLIPFICNFSQSIEYTLSDSGDSANVYVESYEQEL